MTVVDNFFTGRKRNIEHWVGHENFEMLHHDIVNPLYIEGQCHGVIELVSNFLISKIKKNRSGICVVYILI